MGDFDGDGCNDVSLWWNDTNRTHFSVYSFKKNASLLLVFDSHPEVAFEYFGDLNGDSTIEIVIKDKVYSFTNTGVKKKAQ